MRVHPSLCPAAQGRIGGVWACLLAALLLVSGAVVLVATGLLAGFGGSALALAGTHGGGAALIAGLALAFAVVVTRAERARSERVMAAQTAMLAGREAMLTALIDNLPGAVAQLAVDEPGVPLAFVGGEIEKMTGRSRSELIGAPADRLLSIVHPDDRRRVALAHARAMKNVAAFQIEFRIVDSDGVIRWVSERAQATSDEHGVVRTVDGVLVDATERRVAQERIVDAEERYRRLVEEIPLVVYLREVAEADARLLYVGPQVESVTGYSPWEWLAPTELWRRALHEEDRARVLEAQRRHYELGEPLTEEYRITRKDGSCAWLRDEAVVERDDEGGIVASRGYIIDVTERKELEEQLSHQAVHDALTGLPNRVLLRDRVADALERRELQGGAVALLFIDLDDFKTVNDQLGHQVGDTLLAEVANRLRNVIRPGDTPARLGGDEYAVLLEDCDGIADANTVVARISKAIAEPVVVEGRDVVIGASVGIAIEDGRGGSADDLIHDADVAMYHAKEAGKGRSTTFRPGMRAAAALRVERTSDLRRAFERGEFSLRYQPIVAMQTGAVAGLEALVRWEHPRWREMTPGDFIPLAEETGLIVPLGEWVLESVCEISKQWTNGSAGRSASWLSVNVSLRELQEPDYGSRVAEIVERTGVEPQTIMLEFTEGAVMTDLDATIEKLAHLRSLGLRVAVDDFGTGYTSLEYLGRLPIDMVKVVSPGVAGLARRRADDELARAIVHASDVAKIEAVAEGVQMAAQRDRLLELGYRLGQGYFFAEPFAEDKVRPALDVLRLRVA